MMKLVCLALLLIVNTCSSQCTTNDECTDIQWCAPTEVENVSSCKEYSTNGEPCEGRLLPQFQNTCNPSTHRCYMPDKCRVADIPGTCQELTDLNKEDDCCFSGEECESGICASDGVSDMSPTVCQKDDSTANVSTEACTTDDDCSAGKWCASHSTEANFCKEYAAPSASCEGFTLPEYMEYCNSETHYCYKPESCVIPDAAGTCESKDTHRSKVGDCCSSGEDCESGTCTDGQTYIGTTQQVCVEENKSNIGNTVNADECTTDDDCSAGKWCASHSTEANFCKEYAAPSTSCEGFTLPEYMEYCNSETHYCYKPESCVIPDAAGTCESKDTHRSNVGDCCSSGEDCESGSCVEGETIIGTTQNLCFRENDSGSIVDNIGENQESNTNIDDSGAFVFGTMTAFCTLCVTLMGM